MKVLVAGGGIGGLAAGIALIQAGCEVTVYERATELADVGSGLSLWANALSALEHLELKTEVLARSKVELDGGNLRTWQGDIITRGSFEPLRERFGEVVVGIHRADLQSLLLEKLGAERVKLGSSLKGFSETPERVTAHFSSGDAETGDALIGADGLHSRVRAQLHGEAPPRYAGYSAWRGVVPYALSANQAGEYWGRGARFGCLPLAENRTYWFAMRNQPAAQYADGGEKALLQSTFRDWCDPAPALVAATPEKSILRNDIFDRPPLKRWGRGRVTLLGDAAHPMTPNLGQGACQALEDAVVLGRHLKGAAVVRALTSYEAERRARTTRIVQQSAGLGHVVQWENPLLRALRNLTFKYGLSRLQTRQLESLLTFEG